jgi:hypothetical protein
MCMEYIDDETYEVVSDQVKILKNYVYSYNFVLQFIALIPFQYTPIFEGDKGSCNILLIKVFFRMPRMYHVVNPLFFYKMISRYLNNKILKSI